MGPNRYLIDTNIISKLFEGSLSVKAVELLTDLPINEQYISIINRIELLSWKELKGEKLKNVSVFITEINELALSEDIVDQTIKIRKGVSIRLPDAIIAATAIVHGITLLSDNDKDFSRISGLHYLNPTKL
jgi:predicted nucleic acid-binding protein